MLLFHVLLFPFFLLAAAGCLAALRRARTRQPSPPQANGRRPAVLAVGAFLFGALLTDYLHYKPIYIRGNLLCGHASTAAATTVSAASSSANTPGIVHDCRTLGMTYLLGGWISLAVGIALLIVLASMVSQSLRKGYRQPARPIAADRRSNAGKNPKRP